MSTWWIDEDEEFGGELLRWNGNVIAQVTGEEQDGTREAYAALVALVRPVGGVVSADFTAAKERIAREIEIVEQAKSLLEAAGMFIVADNQAVHEGVVHDIEVQAVSEAQSYHATYTLKSGVIPSGPVRYGRTVTARLRTVGEA